MKRIGVFFIAMCICATQVWAIVTSEVVKIRANGDGSTVDFDFPFRYFEDTDLKVYKIDTSSDPEIATLQTLSTDYSVTPANTGEGGTITYVTAPTADEDSFIKLDLPYKNEVDIPTAGILREEAIENAKDINALLIQQLYEAQSRSLLLSETSSITGITFEDPIDSRGLKWELDGSNWTIAPSDYDPDEQVTLATAQAVIATAQAGLAGASAIAAAASEAAAANSAASINCPDISTATAGQGLKVKADKSGYEFANIIEEEDTSTASFAFVVDEDNMASDSATKVPTQQSVKSHVAAEKGYKFVERSPEASAADYTAQTPSTWTDYDVSSIIPAGAKLVKCLIVLSRATGTCRVSFRKNGQSGEYQVQNIYEGSSAEQNAVLDIPVDTSRIFEAKGASLTGGNSFSLTVLGYWI